MRPEAREIGRLIEALEGARAPDEALDLVVREARRVLGAYGSYVTLLEDEEMLVLEVSGLPPGLLTPGEPAIEPSPAATAARTGEPVLIESRRQFLRTYPNLESLPTVAAVALPLRDADSTVIGSLEYAFPDASRMHESLRRTLQGLADRFAQALCRTMDDPRELLDQRSSKDQPATPSAPPLHWFRHEVRDLLQSIYVHTETMAIKEPAVQQLALRVQESAGSIERLLQLLSFGDDDPGIDLSVETLDPADVVSRACDWIDEFARSASVELDVEIAEGCPPVRADREWTSHVMRNLLLNAVRHAADGGRIIVRAGPHRDVVRFTVEDHGPGIPPELHRQIFLPGWSTGEELGGYGLAIARTIVEAQGGRIWVESGEGRGTSFHFTLRPKGPPGDPADR